MNSSYKVEIETYSGPLDLLLYLIKKSEIDVFDVTISQIINQYLDYLQEQVEIDVDSMGEFLLIATSLLEIKSKLVLPREEMDLEETLRDPRFNLVEEILQFRRFKRLGTFLQEREALEEKKFTSPAQELPVDESEFFSLFETVLSNIDIWDLFKAYDRVAREIEAPPPIVYEQIPIEDIIGYVYSYIQEREKAEMVTLLKSRKDEGWIPGAFIAILELIRQKKITAYQEKAFDKVWLTLRDPDRTDDEL